MYHNYLLNCFSNRFELIAYSGIQCFFRRTLLKKGFFFQLDWGVENQSMSFLTFLGSQFNGYLYIFALFFLSKYIYIRITTSSSKWLLLWFFKNKNTSIMILGKKLPLENMVLFSHMCNIHLVVVFKKDVRWIFNLESPRLVVNMKKYFFFQPKW